MQERDVHIRVNAKKSKYEQRDWILYNHIRIDMFLEKGIPDMIEEMHITFAGPVAGMMQIYRVTDEALIAETMVWPNCFLIIVLFALKGSKYFIIIE